MITLLPHLVIQNLMMEQTQTGIRLQHTLVKGIMNTAELVSAFVAALGTHYRNCSKEVATSAVSIEEPKKLIEIQFSSVAPPVSGSQCPLPLKLSSSLLFRPS